ncbi:hypothetical protein [Streptomyces chrestomyceticus]|uniref:hypothetical protein n=1 Tax=Streptomyces chrestomyceticus TaxID=68185 RepID=UPI0019D08763|nr:hypothetical protein [Streptomyces chrestomyceticus]
MTQRNSYGSRRDFLPAFMKSGAGAADGHTEIQELSLDESRALEAVSLNRFPQLPGGEIGWAGGSYSERLWYEDDAEGMRQIAELLARNIRQGAQVVIFWGTLVMPSVRLAAYDVVRHVEEILDEFPHFWVYSAEDRKLIEFLPDGQVTAAVIPGEPSA